MSDLSDDPIVKRTETGVALLEVPIHKYVDKVTKVYKKSEGVTAEGFDFDCSDTKGLIFALTLNRHFGMDCKSEIPGHLATKLARGASFRELNSSGSYHFEISKYDCNLHRDTVSVVAGRDEHGCIIYESDNLLQHLVSDHLNRPNIIAPNREDGFVWGFRFGR